MPRTRCPHCQTVQAFEEEDRGTVQTCSSCEKTFRAPGAPKDKAAPPKPAAKTEPAGRAAKPPPPDDEDDVTELDEVTEDDEDEPEEVTAADDEDEDRPRRKGSKKKKRRPRRPAEGFSLVDTIPIDYTSQVNLGVGIYILVQLTAFMVSRTFGPVVQMMMVPLLLFGLVCYLWGCAAYAKNKNYSQWLGLLGLLWFLGLIILVCLPYRQAEEQ